MSCGPPRRTNDRASVVEGLGELNAIAIRVEYVAEAHLSCQLQDDADVDLFGAEAVRFGLDVLDVDHRDARLALRRGLALGDGDVHLVARELRPAVVEVDERLV